jgi:hypothetical protein
MSWSLAAIMKPKSKKPTNKLSAADREGARKFNEAIGWIKHLDNASNYHGTTGTELYSDHVYVSALNTLGLIFVTRMINLAKAGDSEAIRYMVRYCCEMSEAIEEIAGKKSESLIKWAKGRANWPVMLCRHETSAKPVAAYLDKIKLGSECIINANGVQVAKYSLRTPINRFVWRKLKGLRFSIDLMSEVPGIAKIDFDSLPKLTKANAKAWADKALMPYITAMYENFSEVPEFSAILARPGVTTRGQQRREIRKDVIRALQSLAPAG